MTWRVTVVIDSCKSKEFNIFLIKKEIFLVFPVVLVVPGVIAPYCLGCKYDLEDLKCHIFSQKRKYFWWFPVVVGSSRCFLLNVV